MARIESVAVGGYYKTPPEVTAVIGRLIDLPEKINGYPVLFDPCAGDGEALVDLAQSILPWQWSSYNGKITPRLYACELEEARAEALADRLRKVNMATSASIQADAFCLESKADTVNLLYLNPPYDQFGGQRFEQRWLERFTSWLVPDSGILVYVVPHKTLAVGAEFLARQYRDIVCYRFPDGHFEAFKQVVLVGVRRENEALFGSASAQALIERWAVDPDTIPQLVAPLRKAATLTGGRDDLRRLEAQPLDLEGVYEAYRPFMANVAKGDPVRGIGLETDVTEMIGARYPVVIPPKPVHVATALASGLINGQRVEPDDPQSGLPPIMVKGVFQKEYKKLDERKDKETGEVTAEVHVQQPRLTVTALNLETFAYYELAQGAEPTGAEELAAFNVADLLKHYGGALSDLMIRNCPPLHDPNDPAQQIDLPPLGLRPFRIQRDSITAGLKVLATAREPFVGVNPFLLGQVGTGKTLAALAVSEALTPAHYERTMAELARTGVGGGAVAPVRRVLVMCPPHLLQSWKDEAKKIVPQARVTILRKMPDVDAAAALPPRDRDGIGGQLDIFVMSREAAKLGHAWDTALENGRCPGCGKRHKDSRSLITQRRRCVEPAARPSNPAARWSRELATALTGVFPEDDIVAGLLADVRIADLRRQRLTASNEEDRADAWERLTRQGWEGALSSYRSGTLGRLLDGLRAEVRGALAAEKWKRALRTVRTLQVLFMVVDTADRNRAIAETVQDVMEAARAASGEVPYGTGSDLIDAVGLLAFAMTVPGNEEQLRVLEYLREFRGRVAGYRGSDVVGSIDKHLRILGREWRGETAGSYDYNSLGVSASGGVIKLGKSYQSNKIALGEARAALALLEALAEQSVWVEETCDTPLFQAAARPRRFPLANYICDRFPDLFDILVLDEAHEYNNDGSAQERAAHRLTELGKPTLVLTGTSNNGYASSLFMNMWALSRRFRAEYDRDQIPEFVTRYGYQKVLVERADGKPLRAEFGAVSDRTQSAAEITIRKMGQAPGVLPLFILRHLLTVAAPMHKGDLDVELPPLVEIGEPIEITVPELRAEYSRLQNKLLAQIVDDMQDEERAGKLWGQLTQLPTMLDRAHEDTGNARGPFGNRYEIRYPEALKSELVVAANPLPAEVLTDKEEWALDVIGRELGQERPVMLFIWNTQGNLPQRLMRLIDRKFGDGTAVYMDASRVSTAKRQDWITKNVVKARRKVMLVNPTAVETGLNNLTYFPTAIWFQVPPSCSSVVYDQANGRIHRPGQDADEVRVYVPFFEETAQEAQFQLLGHKVEASRQADGVDIGSALRSVGAEDTDAIDAMAVGRALYEMLTKRSQRRASTFASVRVNGSAHKIATGARPEVAAVPEPAAVPASGSQMSLFADWG